MVNKPLIRPYFWGGVALGGVARIPMKIGFHWGNFHPTPFVAPYLHPTVVATQRILWKFLHPDPWGFHDPILTDAHIFEMGWFNSTTKGLYYPVILGL